MLRRFFAVAILWLLWARRFKCTYLRHDASFAIDKYFVAFFQHEDQLLVRFATPFIKFFTDVIQDDVTPPFEGIANCRYAQNPSRFVGNTAGLVVVADVGGNVGAVHVKFEARTQILYAKNIEEFYDAKLLPIAQAIVMQRSGLDTRILIRTPWPIAQVEVRSRRVEDVKRFVNHKVQQISQQIPSYTKIAVLHTEISEEGMHSAHLLPNINDLFLLSVWLKVYNGHKHSPQSQLKITKQFNCDPLYPFVSLKNKLKRYAAAKSRKRMQDRKHWGKEMACDEGDDAKQNLQHKQKLNTNKNSPCEKNDEEEELEKMAYKKLRLNENTPNCTMHMQSFNEQPRASLRIKQRQEQKSKIAAQINAQIAVQKEETAAHNKRDENNDNKFAECKKSNFQQPNDSANYSLHDYFAKYKQITSIRVFTESSFKNQDNLNSDSNCKMADVMFKAPQISLNTNANIILPKIQNRSNSILVKIEEDDNSSIKESSESSLKMDMQSSKLNAEKPCESDDSSQNELLMLQMYVVRLLGALPHAAFSMSDLPKLFALFLVCCWEKHGEVLKSCGIADEVYESAPHFDLLEVSQRLSTIVKYCKEAARCSTRLSLFIAKAFGFSVAIYDFDSVANRNIFLNKNCLLLLVLRVKRGLVDVCAVKNPAVVSESTCTTAKLNAEFVFKMRQITTCYLLAKSGTHAQVPLDDVYSSLHSLKLLVNTTSEFAFEDLSEWGLYQESLISVREWRGAAKIPSDAQQSLRFLVDETSDNQAKIMQQNKILIDALLRSNSKTAREALKQILRAGFTEFSHCINAKKNLQKAQALRRFLRLSGLADRPYFSNDFTAFDGVLIKHLDYAGNMIVAAILNKVCLMLLDFIPSTLVKKVVHKAFIAPSRLNFYTLQRVFMEKGTLNNLEMRNSINLCFSVDVFYGTKQEISGKRGPGRPPLINNNSTIIKETVDINNTIATFEEIVAMLSVSNVQNVKEQHTIVEFVESQRWTSILLLFLERRAAIIKMPLTMHLLEIIIFCRNSLRPDFAQFVEELMSLERIGRLIVAAIPALVKQRGVKCPLAEAGVTILINYFYVEELAKIVPQNCLLFSTNFGRSAISKKITFLRWLITPKSFVPHSLFTTNFYVMCAMENVHMMAEAIELLERQKKFITHQLSVALIGTVYAKIHRFMAKKVFALSPDDHNAFTEIFPQLKNVAQNIMLKEVKQLLVQNVISHYWQPLIDEMFDKERNLLLDREPSDAEQTEIETKTLLIEFEIARLDTDFCRLRRIDKQISEILTKKHIFLSKDVLNKALTLRQELEKEIDAYIFIEDAVNSN